MALYRLSVGVVARGRTGRLTARSAVAAAAYQAREELQDEARRQPLDFSSVASDLVMSEILLPKLAPYRWFDREVLWNEVEARERRTDARLARSVVLTLPRELDVFSGADLAREFFLDAFVKRGMVADMAVHLAVSRDHEPQPHAHALLTTRRIVDGVFGLKERAWNSVALLREWRQEWADMANRRLAQRGASTRLDHRRWFLWSKGPEMRPQRDAEMRHPIRDAARIAGALAIIGASLTTQAMRDAARRLRPHGRSPAVPTAAPKTPVEALRDELRRPLRAAAVGVAAGAWSYGEAADRLVADHVLPALRRHPELETRFEELEQGVGSALAKAAGRLEAQIAHNAGLLRERAKWRDVTMSDGNRLDADGRLVTTQEMRDLARRVPGAGLTAAERVEVAETRVRWATIEASPEFKQMQWEVEQKIASLASGEAGTLSVDRKEPTQEERDRARLSMPAPAQAMRSTDYQAQQASRRAQETETQTHALTL